ncbi:sulfurtransferase/chromate resistance protein [Sinirhodobacter sp. WL0062]|uniref:Sulfurtransferase/chromate resistance protein n=1 Tax=Rhodobacter flavimaris TaxID=2907145 RepID=A0ABS8YY83_9RHOB|nr:sulfurtransferase/chromate resistance protein [Sinirhodobacter sp. WL0062]MCE5973533.1 sulfurtransferase/chromate resistance protein [Sinirhodobacter sp. WL0062]
MPAPDAITPDKLAKLIGTPRCPIILDTRRDALRAEDALVLPGARAIPEVEMAPERLAPLIATLQGPVVVACAEGHSRSQGLAALLRSQGIAAEYLEGGYAAWRDAGLPLIDPGKITARDAEGRSVWVTRSRPKVDRIACPWLIRRFIDPRAVFLYVAPAEVAGVAALFGGMAFDVEDTFWSHRGDLCTFDVMLAEFGLKLPALDRLAVIVRGADTARPDLAPEAPGLLAASLGLSRMYSDDLEQLEAGMALYDAFYRWCRDATGETHNWPTNRPGGAA